MINVANETIHSMLIPLMLAQFHVVDVGPFTQITRESYFRVRLLHSRSIPRRFRSGPVGVRQQSSKRVLHRGTAGAWCDQRRRRRCLLLRQQGFPMVPVDVGTAFGQWAVRLAAVWAGEGTGEIGQWVGEFGGCLRVQFRHVLQQPRLAHKSHLKIITHVKNAVSKG